MPALRRTLFRVGALFGGVVIPLLIIEMVLRFLPVCELTDTLPVNESQPVFRFRPDRDFTWSRDWDLSLANTVHINNMGFVSERDYSTTETSPLLAIIGDSFVEALMVPPDSTIHSILQGHVGQRGRVYCFAASAAPLSQYVAWANYAKRTFHPEGYVFVLVANDFDQSYRRYRAIEGFHYFGDSGEATKLQRLDYEPGTLGTLAKKSALASYLLANLRIVTRLRWAFGGKEYTDYYGPVGVAVTREQFEDSKKALVTFLDCLEASGISPREVLLVVDGMRPFLDRPGIELEREATFWQQLREWIWAQSVSRGYEVADMEPRFQKAYSIDNHAFEYPNDAHWNGKAHLLAARAIEESQLFANVFRARVGVNPVESESRQ